MLDRRQILAGLGTVAMMTVIPKALLAATPIKLDDASALLVIDVQNCFLPGGSLAVKDGDQVIPVINRIAKGFANMVMTQDWHAAGHVSFASSHPGKKPFEMIDLPYGKQMLWPEDCVQGTEGAALSKDLSIPQAELVIRKGIPQGRRQLFGVHRGRRQDHDRTCRLSAGPRRSSVCSSPGWRLTSVSPGPRSMRARPASRPMWSKTPAAESTPRARCAKAWADMAQAGVKRIQSGDIEV